jgi:hypothetical protein
MSLVSDLRLWIEANRDRLASNAVSVTDKLPRKGDDVQDKGCIGLSKDHILTSFTAWDRRPIPIELLVYNTHMDKTVIMRDYEVRRVRQALDELDNVADLLVSGKYDDMKPDPTLSIS